MSFDQDNRERFDHWSETYEMDVAASRGFPFEGYSRTLIETVSTAEVVAGMSMLDLGTGTGALASRFLAEGCLVWGTDFSSAMIQRARRKYPEIQFSVAELRDELPVDLPKQYDRIVSAYAFHHLEVWDKARLIQLLIRDRLTKQGLVRGMDKLLGFNKI